MSCANDMHQSNYENTRVKYKLHMTACGLNVQISYFSTLVLEYN